MLTVAPRIVNDVSYVMWINHEIHFAWQVQHLVKFMCHFSWQAQHLVKFVCDFSWQAQHVVKFGMIAGAGNGVISIESAPGGAAGCGLRFLGRIMVGSCSDHGRIGRALEMTFQLFSVNFPQIWECNFAWQAQYLVRLQGDACCSAHCK